jgi:hypothetical protein
VIVHSIATVTIYRYQVNRLNGYWKSTQLIELHGFLRSSINGDSFLQSGDFIQIISVRAREADPRSSFHFSAGNQRSLARVFLGRLILWK